MDQHEWVNKVTIRPHELRPGMAMAIKVVCVLHDIGPYWCAYLGLSDWPDEKVAGMGDQIPEEAALMLFPVMQRVEGLTYYNP